MAVKRRKGRASPKPPVSVEASLVNHDRAGSSQTFGAFPVVGIGASAGGLEAVTSLLRALPENPGAAFVLVQHQEPTHESMLAHILTRTTTMEVRSVTSDVQLQPNTLYVAPAHGQLVVENGMLRLMSITSTSMTIDNFFRSLAEDLGSRAIGVVLSGAASDGSAGTKVIKAEGGVTFAQDGSAKFDSMPKSAIASGAVDFVLSPQEIARELVRIARSAIDSADETAGRLSTTDMQDVLAILRRWQDVDFTQYKTPTVERRVRRRMALRRVDSLAEYLTILQQDRGEVEQLYGDLLIRVTGFFRDSEVFETLKRDIFPKLMTNRLDDRAVRVWVPGCATGEEVYSLAISFLELSPAYSCPIQIFGTDISESSVEHARAGIYRDSDLKNVPPDRLRRFFAKTNGSYRVAKAVRDCCIFSRQNVTKDPPFSKVDLISCRNVMIYLGAVLQRKIMSIFHYALRPDGYLLLGSAETIGSFGNLFSVTDRTKRIYQKKASAARAAVEFETIRRARDEREKRPADAEPPLTTVYREADRVLLMRYVPAGVVINESMEILQFRGRTNAFLEPAPGTASLNLLKMAKEGLGVELRNAIQAARKNDAAVRREGIHVKNDDEEIVVNVEVLPFVTPSNERYQLVLFEGTTPEEKTDRKRRKGKGESSDSRQLQRLKRQLEATREYLQSVIEQLESMNEDLRSANEEIQSSNEELQATNEELETAKEELQSANEELITLNEELGNRNQELGEVNNDLVNLLTSVDIPILILDNAMRIRRFNPDAERALNLVPADLGRSISDINRTLDLQDLDRVVGSVLGEFDLRELDVQDRSGKTYSLRIRPYKTMENKVEGAVLVLIEKNGPKR